MSSGRRPVSLLAKTRSSTIRLRKSCAIRTNPRLRKNGGPFSLFGDTPFVASFFEGLGICRFPAHIGKMKKSPRVIFPRSGSLMVIGKLKPIAPELKFDASRGSPVRPILMSGWLETERSPGLDRRATRNRLERRCSDGGSKDPYIRFK